eukprot:scaffold569_cov408-Prasinococcus_capsulatus_cf.AAC.15
MPTQVGAVLNTCDVFLAVEWRSSQEPTRVIPADLNAFIYRLASNLSKFFSILSEEEKSKRYETIAKERLDAITQVLWNEQLGCWCDLWMGDERDDKQQIGPFNAHHNTRAYASNWIPMWCGCSTSAAQTSKAIESLDQSGLLQVGGVATSLVESGEQWDFPNAWPPLQHMLIEGLSQTNSKGRELGSRLAKTWLDANREAYRASGHMHEKLRCDQAGDIGKGGEYVPQIGFGWSNGVVLALMRSYGYPPKIDSRLQFVRPLTYTDYAGEMST